MKRSRSTCSSPSSDSVVELTEEEVARLQSRQSRSRRERRLEIALRQGDLDRAQQVLRDQERERRRRQVQADADLARSIQARADEEFARSLQARRSPPHAAQPRFHQHHFASALLARSSLRGAAAQEGLAQIALLNGRDIDQLDYDELWELSERIGDVRRRGADKREIERLPTRTFDNQASSAEEQSCSICLEAFAQGERVRTLLCLHVFHAVCVDNWLTMNKICPVCRIPIDKR
ncbi:unnamed protein product (mitochondrion) [Plasmodiophora brassicae]|uniref:RING-type E3 ubiquitin transferase n=2 Tax=Plasmodiophora brassicae TaxID=37360 RepID=A0A3P3YNA8_PLABS|nr:unnamed protein product [Plasmodiophora brassicae]